MRAFVNGIALDFDLVGNGPTLVLIHALGVDRRMWAQQVPVFAEGRQVLAYDVRGHGRSDKPAGPYTLEALADDLRGLLDSLGIQRASLLGISMGGMIAQTFALRYPDQVDLLILADTTSEYPPEGRRQFVERARQVEASGIEPIVPATLERWFTPEFRVEDEETVEEIRKILAAADPAGYAGACLAVSQVDTTARLGQIQAPTLVIVGEKDPGTPVEAAARIQAAIPGARLEVIPDASHLSNVAHPGAFDDLVLGFLGVGEALDLEGVPDEEWTDLPPGGIDLAAVPEGDVEAIDDLVVPYGDVAPAEEAPSALPEAGVGASGGGPPEEGYPEGPRTDQQVTDGVLAAFFLAPDLQDAQFHVETVGGVVRLAGRVRSEDARRRAVEIAAGVAGVQRVIDELVTG